MVGWHHQLDGREFEWTPELVMDGRPACCDSWGCKELDTTEWLNWTELKQHLVVLLLKVILVFYFRTIHKSLLQHHSSKTSILWCSAFFTVQLSHPYMTTGKTIALTRQTFVGKVISLLFNMLSRLVITFLPRSKGLLISWLQSPSVVILEPKKIVKNGLHCFPIYLPWNDGTGCHDLSFLNVGL